MKYTVFLLIGVLIAVSSAPALAQKIDKDEKSREEKAVDSARKFLGGLLGEDAKPDKRDKKATPQPAKATPRPDAAPVAGEGRTTKPLRRDKFGNVIREGPPPAGLEKPIDAPPDKPMPGAAGVGRKPIDAPAPAAAPGQSAADLADKKSQDLGGGEVTLTVTNGTRSAIRVNWIDQDGKEGRSDDTIPAGETVELGTTGAGHFFRARDAKSNALLQEFRVKNQRGKFNITIGSAGAAPAPAAKPVAAAPAPAAPPPAPAAVAKGGVPAKGPHVDKATAKKQLKTDMDAKIDEFMKLHNDARAAVGVPPLEWDAKLAAVAQQWADTLAARGNALVHNDQIPYGENLAGYLPEYGERPVHGAKMWYDEIKLYRDAGPMTPTNYAQCGHYTQMVARRSHRVGFGVALAPNGMAILCANYDPPGNMQGEHPINPLP